MLPGSESTSVSKSDRVARVVVVVASVWFAFAAAWGMFGIPGGGHLGAGSAACALAGEPIARWKILYPAWPSFGAAPPATSSYICHHPFGFAYLTAFFIWIFGIHDFVVYLPEVLMSAAIPPLLYGIGKECWGAPLGAVAAAAYVVVPIAVGFSSYMNLETTCIFGALLFFWGHSRHTTTGKTRYLLASLAGVGFVCAGDWAGYLLIAPTLGWAFCRAFVFPARMALHIRYAAYARWWALSVALALGIFLFWMGLFHHVHRIGDWLAAGDMRSGGNTKTLRATLAERKEWIDFSFTPFAILLGKIALPVCVLRLIVLRRDEETYSLGLLFGAVVQYVVFKEGADIHIFWPHYFAPYFALALAQLAGTVAWVARSVVRRVAPSRAKVVSTATALVVGLLPVAAMAHDGVQSLWVWRRTGGRYDDHGTAIRSDVAFLFVLEKVVMPQVPRGTPIDVHPSVGWYWDHMWKYQGPFNSVAAPSSDGGAAVATHPFWIARGGDLSPEEQKKIVASAHVRIYGGMWVVDQRERAAPLDAYSLNEREPNAFEWLVYGGTEPMRSIGPAPDPWLTWEWRRHLGQAAQPPTGQPRTLDEIRIAHNVAVDRGDWAEAARWLDRIQAQIDSTVASAFDHGIRLVGVRVTGGVQPRLETWFQCDGPVGDAIFAVRSSILARAPFSLIPPDKTDRNMLGPSPVPAALWRPGMLYKVEDVLNHRIGSERYAGVWVSRGGLPAPRRSDGQRETTLAVVP